MAQPAPGQTGLAGALRADVGTKLVSKFPQLPKARGTPVWPVSGVSAGAVLARRNAAVTQGPGGPRQLCYQPPDGCCWAMAASQPRAGQGGRPSSSGTATQPWASLFSLFFPLPSGKQYLSAYIMLASPERPAASAADLSPLLRTVPGGAGGNERRSRAQGPSGSHGAWPGPSPAPAGNTRPRPHAVPGMGSLCWEQWRIPSPRNLQSRRGWALLSCTARTAREGRPEPCLSQRSPFPPSPRLPVMDPLFSQLCLLPGSLLLAVGGLIPRPLARSHPGPCRGRDFLHPVTGPTCCRCRRCCQVPVPELCPLPFPPCTACGDPCFCRQGGCHSSRVHGECVLLRAPGMDAEDTRVHIQTAPCIWGVMRTPHTRDGPGCCGQWDQSTSSSFRGS